MSFNAIETALGHLERDRLLMPYKPKSRRGAKRRLYLTRQLMDKFDDASSAVNILVGRGRIEAAFTRWTLGERVYSDGKKAAFLKRLDEPPPEIWEIRVTEPTVQARAFGRFIAPDTLILTDMHTRPMLGKRGSVNWNNACNNCVAQWSALFLDLAPMSAKRIHDYVTGNCDDFTI